MNGATSTLTRAEGSEGDELHAVLCAAGLDIRWLLRAIAAHAAKAALFCLRACGDAAAEVAYRPANARMWHLRTAIAEMSGWISG
jgi:hypothetical protein